MTVFVFFISIVCLAWKFYRSKTEYKPIWAGFAIPIALPILDGMVTWKDYKWIGGLEIFFGVVGVILMIIYEVRGLKLAIDQNR